jgi:hypothetical protein
MARKRSSCSGLNMKLGANRRLKTQEDQDESISMLDNAKEQEVKNPIPQRSPSVMGGQKPPCVCKPLTPALPTAVKILLSSTTRMDGFIDDLICVFLGSLWQC